MIRRHVAGVIACSALAAAVVWISVGPVARAQSTTTDLTALTAEVHQLRLAVEDAARAQTQTQALAVYLSAQQSRFIQSANRLDAIRKDLDDTTLQIRSLTADLADAQRALSRATEFRPEFEDRVAHVKHDLDAAVAAEQQLRTREAAAQNDVRQDEATWRDLIARLEQTVKR